MSLRFVLRRKASLVLMATVVVATAALQGCSTSGDITKALNPDPPAKMYADADAYLARGSWADAAKKFEDLDRDHPYAPEARRAIVMAAFAYYKAGKFPDAISAARRYTTMHPGTKEAALAHHIIASAHFDEIQVPSRDQTNTRRALAELKTLRSRYPDSPYAKQADNRIRIAEDVLAASEMNVGRYYQKNRNYVAAINRFRTVVVEYQTTAHVEEALFRLTETYMFLGIRNEAQTAAAVLGHNFPESRWYKDSYALLRADGLTPSVSAGSWITKAVQSLTPGAKPSAPPAKPTPDDLPIPPTGPLPPVAPPPADAPTAATPGAKRVSLTGG